MTEPTPSNPPSPPAKRQAEDILVRAMNGSMGCCDCDGNKAAFRECGMEISKLRYEVERLQTAIRRLTDQDATLSVCGGNVTVTMDATLTDAEREAVALAEAELKDISPAGAQCAATLRKLLERFK